MDLESDEDEDREDDEEDEEELEDEGEEEEGEEEEGEEEEDDNEDEEEDIPEKPLKRARRLINKDDENGSCTECGLITPRGCQHSKYMCKCCCAVFEHKYNMKQDSSKKCNFAHLVCPHPASNCPFKKKCKVEVADHEDKLSTRNSLSLLRLNSLSSHRLSSSSSFALDLCPSFFSYCFAVLFCFTSHSLALLIVSFRRSLLTCFVNMSCRCYE
jgi:hypothetical protein